MSKETVKILNYLAVAAGLVAIALLVYGIVKALA